MQVKVLFRLICVVFASVSLYEQGRGQDANEGAVVAGTVRTANGEPVAGADVVVLAVRASGDPLVAIVRTDKEGRYRAKGLTVGRYVLLVDERRAVASVRRLGLYHALFAGFVRDSLQDYDGPTVRVPKAGATVQHDIALPRSTTFAGQVVHAGKGVAGATVTLLPRDGGRWVAPVVTDAKGRFSLERVAVGRYAVVCSDGQFEIRCGTVRVDDTGASPVVFRLGERTLRIDLRYSDGTPVTRVDLIRVRDVEASSRQVLCREQASDTGLYRIPFVAGARVSVEVRVGPVETTKDLEMTSVLVDAKVKMPPVASLVVAVRDESGRPIAGAPFRIASKRGTPECVYQTGADGGFTIAMPPGEWYVGLLGEDLAWKNAPIRVHLVAGKRKVLVLRSDHR